MDVYHGGCFIGTQNSTRPLRPRKHWIDNIQEAVQSRGSTLADVERPASSMIKDAGEASQTGLGLPVKWYKVQSIGAAD